MHVEFNKKNLSAIITFSNGETQEFKISNKSIVNKVDILVKDLNALSQYNIEFEPYFMSLFNALVVDNTYDTSHFNKAIEFSKDFITIHKIDINSFCDANKRTKNSVYFDIDDISELLSAIGILKIFSLFMYSQYSNKVSLFIDELDKKYSKIISKVYKIIKTRVIRGAGFNAMSLIKVEMTLDYLIMYNFEFIFLTVLVFYNWQKNPLSFIVSVASDNTNYCLMTFNTVPFLFSTEVIETNADDFLDGISYEIILDQVDNKIDELIRSSNYGINFNNKYLTQINSLVVLPLVSLITDIELKYLQHKNVYDKWTYQLMLYYIVSKSKYIKQLMGDSSRLLLYGFTKPVIATSVISPAVLEVLKTEVKYSQMNSRVPLINYAQELSTVTVKYQLLTHIIDKNDKFPASPDFAKKIGKELIKFSMNLFDDEVVSNMREEGKGLFLDFIGDMKLSGKTLSKLL